MCADCEVPVQTGEFLPAQVIVTEGSKSLWSRLVRWATGSRWTHVFMVMNDRFGIEAGKGHRVRLFRLHERLNTLDAEGREWRVLDLPWLTVQARCYVADRAETHLGRRYDPVQAILYGVSGRFFRDGSKRVICSRLITAAYAAGGWNLFEDWWIEQFPNLSAHHAEQLRRGYVTPEELLTYSRLQDVTHRNWRAGIANASRALLDDLEDFETDDYPVPAYPLTDTPT